ncbi:MAG: hypothetical protein R3F11_22945 [Verrucomicrobiales bacterium]
MNIGAQAVNLGGVRLIDGVNFDFDQDGTLAAPVLAPGARLLAAIPPNSPPPIRAQRTVAGRFIGDLSNSGERLVLVAAELRHPPSATTTVALAEPADAMPSPRSSRRNRTPITLPRSWPSAAEGGSPRAAFCSMAIQGGRRRRFVTAFAEHARHQRRRRTDRRSRSRGAAG